MEGWQASSSCSSSTGTVRGFGFSIACQARFAGVGQGPLRRAFVLKARVPDFFSCGGSTGALGGWWVGGVSK